jgi:hypothetical protein
VINAAIDPPHFKMPALQQLRDDAFPGCCWQKSDIAAAFPTMGIALTDLPWMLFAWYAPDDIDFLGTDQDYLYVHTHANFGPRPWPYEFSLLMLFVNLAAAATGIEYPAAFIDDNIHTGMQADLVAMAPKYWDFLTRAGIPDKPAKREFVLHAGDLLGRWFNSMNMMMSIPQDKLTRLTGMLTELRHDPRSSYKTLSQLLGYAEFCFELLPAFMKAFLYTAYMFRNYLKHRKADTKHWNPKHMRQDLLVVENLLPDVNNTVPIQPLNGRWKADPVCTDARGGKRPAGAYVTPDGVEWWEYTGKLRKRIIAWHEGDCLERYLTKHGAELTGSKLPWHCDNKTFLACMHKGRSKTRHLCLLVQRCLLLLYKYDIYLQAHYISTADNILADAACRQLWKTFNANFDTYPVFAECRRKRLQALTNSSANDPLSILAPRVKLAVMEMKETAYETNTKVNARSAWKWWCEYMAECDGDCYIHPNNKQYKTYLLGFKAALMMKFHGDVKSPGTISTYAAQVTWCLSQYHNVGLDRTINRAIGKQLQDGKRYQGSIDLTFFADQYKRYAKCNDIIKIRNLLVYSFLGLTMSRSQAAVTQSADSRLGRTLLLEDTRLDPKRYAVWWGLKHSKGDPFGKRKGRDGKDWTVSKGCRSTKHPIDIYALYCRYCSLMGFSTDPNSREWKRRRKEPFFQKIKRGTPTGAPLTYPDLLNALKQEINDNCPDLVSAEIGTHCFRRFSATLAKTQGLPDDLIQYMGRWSSLCFQSYWMFSDDDKTDMNAALLDP